MYVEKKKISGKFYYYLKSSSREGNKIITKTIAYLGKGDMSKKELEDVIIKFKSDKKTNEKAGDIVEIKTKDSTEKGIVMPSFDSNIEFIKLDSGYNIGFDKKKIKSIKTIGKSEPAGFPELKNKQNKKLPGISMIITGGTIGAKVDYTTGAVKWLNKPEELLAIAPKILDIVNINKIEVPFTIGSENMNPDHWKKIAEKAAQLLNKKENKGIILTHGTDTLHYTAAALSFMLKNLNKPVILTYSQRSPDRGSNDAVLNLTCSAYASLSDIAEVMLVGHGITDDDHCLAIKGTKVRKMHTSRRDAFRPINDLPFAKISEDGKIEIINKNFNKKNNNKVIADTEFEEKTALIKYYPGADSDIINYYMNKKYRGIVIEMVGLGQLATSESEMTWIPMIKKAIKKGVTICAVPQTIYGKLNPLVYSTGREIQETGVIYLEDMLPETAYVKLGWVLGHETDKDKIKELMLKNIAGEFNRSISSKSFLY